MSVHHLLLFIANLTLQRKEQGFFYYNPYKSKMKTKTKGKFVQTKNGTWEIDTKVKINEQFKHLHKTGYKTLKEAQMDYDRVEKEFINKHSNNIQTLFFEDLFEQFETMRSVTVDMSTTQIDKSIYKNYFKCFEGKLLKDVFNRQSVTNWYAQLVNDNSKSNVRKSKVVVLFRQILKFAYQNLIIDAPSYQVCDVSLYPIKYSRTTRKEKIAWTNDELTKFLASVDNGTDKVMFELFFFLATRLGEFLALMPRAFDRNKKTITIEQQVKNVTGNKYQVLTNKLKTQESYRVIALTDEISEMLIDYIDVVGIGENEYLFGKRNEPMSRQTFRRKLEHYVNKANVRMISPHCARHTKATMLASVCETTSDIEACARRMGHSPSMFMDTYGKHNTQETERELIAKLERKNR